MASWATKRKVTYLSIVGGAVFLLVVVPLFLVLYERPTCFDGKRNSDELGVDCGGSCTILCSFEALDPIVLWSRVFRVTDDMYTAVAYVENPNVSSDAHDVPYNFKIYDKDNILITERAGTTYVPRNKRFAVLEAKIPVTERKPRSAKFEFTMQPTWRRSSDDEEPDLFVKNKAMLREDISPRIEAEIENRSLKTLSNLEVTAIVYDGNNNAVGASRTYVDAIRKGESAQAVFTWPLPFEAKLDVCEVPADVMLVIDRSGSMNDDGLDPPQPITDAQRAAQAFVDQLKDSDQIGVVSFATNASDPVDAQLSADREWAKRKISAISIKDGGPLVNTNLGGGLLAALEEIGSARHRAESKRVIVALTDGLATEPTKPDDPKYPETYGIEAANKVKDENVQLYMIGLGKNVNSTYLQSIATDGDHYYFAATSKELKGIYDEIATKICKKRPAVIEIISRIYPDEVEY